MEEILHTLIPRNLPLINSMYLFYCTSFFLFEQRFSVGVLSLRVRYHRIAGLVFPGSFLSKLSEVENYKWEKCMGPGKSSKGRGDTM